MQLQQIKQRFGIIGNSIGLNRTIELAVQVAPTDLSVLITGESGVGKERIPQIIHHNSLRKHEEYIAVNCGAIPEGTIDSELFGHVKGAFTSAVSDRKGYFEVADKGTIFLDEVAELPLSTQTKLLRVLESGEFIRVGSSKVQKTNVRVVAASNVTLPEAIKRNEFREDLFYRLNTVPLFMPPLRDRKDDIHLLFRKFALDFADKYNMPVARLQADAIELIEKYRWPGNIRQLKNITEQISILEHDRSISAITVSSYLPESGISKLPAIYNKSNKQADFSTEREILYKILFDMKSDMNELKKVVNGLLNSDTDIKVSKTDTDILENIYNANEEVEIRSSIVSNPNNETIRNEKKNIDIEETEEYHEENLCLKDMEIELIVKALEKHNGKRKLAADELGISDRTLYRKINQYNLDL